MLVTEIITINDREYTHTYSDEGRYVVRDGVSYCEAIDPVGSGREYTEGEIMEGYSNEATESDYQSALGEFGVEI